MKNFLGWLFLLPLSVIAGISYLVFGLYYCITDVLCRLFNWTYDTDYYDNYNRLMRALEKRNKKDNK